MPKLGCCRKSTTRLLQLSSADYPTEKEVTLYSLEDLEKAQKSLLAWVDRFDRYSGNNPNKYQSDIKAARRQVSMIEEALKSSGSLVMTEKEHIERELDSEFPDTKSKQIVEHQGRKYQRRFWPIEKSRSGKKVMEWGRGWDDVTD
jgi:hypothetical protein